LELSNLDAMIIELSVAGIFAVILSIVLFTKEKDRQEIDGLENKIRDLEHSIQIKEVEIQARKSDSLIRKQYETLERLGHVITRQAIIIENQEQKELHRKRSTLDIITSNLIESKSCLEYIKSVEIIKYKDFRDYVLEFKIFTQDEIEILPRCHKSIEDALFSNYWWIGSNLTREINYTSRLLINYFDGWKHATGTPDEKTFDDTVSTEKQLDWIEKVLPAIKSIKHQLEVA